MKRILLFMIMIAALTILAGCGEGISSSPGFSADDLFLSIDGKQYGLDVNIETVIAGLGDDYEYSQAISCDYDGLDKTYIYDLAEFYTYPLPEGDVVSEIYTKDLSVSTSKGIVVGASKEEVLAGYGDRCEDTGYQLVYKLPDSRESLCFDLENGVVTAFYITTRPS